MNYLVWDTERIKGSQIYMLGYILVDETFKIIREEMIINKSVDVSQRKSPKSKVKRFFNQSTKVEDYTELAELILPIIQNSKSICFGKDDFAALNSQFYINGIETVSGTFYNVEEYVRHLNSELPTNLNMVSKYLKLKHDRHNPLSDSYVTLEYFKYLIKQYPQEEMEMKIPSKKGGKGNDTKWKLLIEKGMTKTDLRIKAEMSTSTLAKMGKNEVVSMNVIIKICEILDCNVSDVMTVDKISE